MQLEREIDQRSPRNDSSDVRWRHCRDFLDEGVNVEALLLDLVQPCGVLRQEEEHLDARDLVGKLQDGTIASGAPLQ